MAGPLAFHLSVPRALRQETAHVRIMEKALLITIESGHENAHARVYSPTARHECNSLMQPCKKYLSPITSQAGLWASGDVTESAAYGDAKGELLLWPRLLMLVWPLCDIPAPSLRAYENQIRATKIDFPLKRLH